MLQNKQSYRKPDGISTATWRARLEAIWTHTGDRPERRELTTKLRSIDINVDDEWELFEKCVENTFRMAYEDLLAINAIENAQEVKRMQAALKMRTRKGGQGKHVLRSVQQMDHEDEPDVAIGRRKRNYMACREALRQLKRQTGVVDTDGWGKNTTLQQSV
jgi:hypothetical protein